MHAVIMRQVVKLTREVVTFITKLFSDQFFVKPVQEAKDRYALPPTHFDISGFKEFRVIQPSADEPRKEDGDMDAALRVGQVGGEVAASMPTGVVVLLIAFRRWHGVEIREGRDSNPGSGNTRSSA